MNRRRNVGSAKITCKWSLENRACVVFSSESSFSCPSPTATRSNDRGSSSITGSNRSSRSEALLACNGGRSCACADAPLTNADFCLYIGSSG